MSSQPASAIAAAQAAIIKRIDACELALKEALKVHTAGLADLMAIQDHELREVIYRLSDDLVARTQQALRYSEIDLRLDSLFDVVTMLTERAESVDAVDIEVNRWEEDERAQRYFDANKAALQRGAVIRRAYVISPNVDLARFRAMVRTFKEHRELNAHPEVKERRGQMEVRCIHHSEFSQLRKDCRGKDFAIFDGDKKVLVELFDSQTWRTTHRGHFIKDPEKISAYRYVFDHIWRRATDLTHMGESDLDGWADEMAPRLGGIDGPGAADHDP